MNDQRIKDLTHELEDVRKQINLTHEKRTYPNPMLDQLWAHEKKLEREIAKLSGKPYALPHDIGCVPEAAVSGAIVIQTEYRTTLLFNAMPPEIPWKESDTIESYRDRRYQSCGPEGFGRAVISFKRCIKSSFGLPNDEAIKGHPLYGHGLEVYGCFEVLNSDWIRELERQNQVSFPKTSYAEMRHFIFSFHDSSFECVASDLSVEFSKDGALEKKILQSALED